MSHSIAKNTAFMTIASIFQKLIAFLYFTLIARSVAPEGTGKYFLAMSFTTIFVVLVDLGMTNVLVREGARVKENMQKYVSTVLFIKLILGGVAYGAVILVSSALYPDRELQHMIWLSGVTMLFDSFNLTVYGVLRAIGDLRFESVSITVSQFLSLILGSIFLFLKLPIIFLILAFTIPSALNAMFATTMVYRKYHVKPLPYFDSSTFSLLWKITLPFALAAIFARVYGYIDSILLGRLLGATAVGFYSIPYKITFAFQFIPLALVAAVYPRFSEYFVHNKEKFSTVLHDSMKYLLIVATPIGIGIAVLARPLILILYTQKYAESIVPLQILIVSLIFSFISFPIGAALNAGNKQVTQTTIVGIVMVINILMNLSLIPLMGVSGAAVSALVGNFLLTAIGYFFLRRVTPVNHGKFALTFVKILSSGLVMGVAVFEFITVLPRLPYLVVSLPLGAVVYGIMILLTRAVTIPEIKEGFRSLLS